MDESWKGKIVGKCKLEKPIGDGAAGVVYKARHITLDIDVAVKLLLPHQCKDDTILRFQQEARTAGLLDHEYVVKIFDVGYENKVHYIVREYVDGHSVEYYLAKQGALPLRKSTQIVKKIAEGLAAAHAVDILHRDIKPANVLLGKNGEVKIADFGVARLSSRNTRLTQAGSIIGTLAYTAPEQFKGEANQSSDLYSLGITYFEMLSGQPPYKGHNPLEYIHHHVHSPIPSIRDQRAEVPEGIDAIISRLMEKDYLDRFANASELAKALEPYTQKKTDLATKKYAPSSVHSSTKKDTESLTKNENKEASKGFSKNNLSINKEELDGLETFEATIDPPTGLSSFWVKTITFLLLFMASISFSVALFIFWFKWKKGL